MAELFCTEDSDAKATMKETPTIECLDPTYSLWNETHDF